MKHNVILFSIIACTITHYSLSMFRLTRVIQHTSPKKNWYHTNPEDKYEKRGRSIINGTLDRKRKQGEMTKIQHAELLPEASSKGNDSSSSNTHQEQALQNFYTQQAVDIAVNIATSSIGHYGW